MLEIKEYFCPNEKCKHYGLRDMGNLVKSGTYTHKGSGEKKQIFKCKVCGGRFSETPSTLFAGLHYSDHQQYHLLYSRGQWYQSDLPNTGIV